MKKSRAVLLSTLGCVLLSGCSNHPLPPKTAIVDTRIIDANNGARITVLTQNAINGDVIEDTDNTLNLVSKADNTKLLALKTLQFAATLLGGGSGDVNGYSKEQLKGNHINSVKNYTMDYVNPQLDEMLKTIDFGAAQGAKIIIKPYKFKLIYEGLTNDDYEFRYSTTIRVGDFYKVCSSEDLLSSERVQPISLWEKNNYQLTQALTQKIIKNCFYEINQKQTKEQFTKALLNSELNTSATSDT